MAVTGLTKRERQIMEILYRHGKVSAAEVQDQMEEAPSYSAVRATLRVLEDKGHVRHESDGQKHLYYPTVDRDKAKLSAVKSLLEIFFGGSPAQVVDALLDVSERLSREDLERMSKMIERAKKEGK